MSDQEEIQIPKRKPGRPRKKLDEIQLPPDDDDVENEDAPAETREQQEQEQPEPPEPPKKKNSRLENLAKARVARVEQMRKYKAEQREKAEKDTEEFFRAEIDKEVKKKLAAERKLLEKEIAQQKK